MASFHTRSLIISVLILVIATGKLILGKTVHKTLVFSPGRVCPDGFCQPGILINNRPPPGPTITLNKGDTLKLCVVNELDHGFSIHMHGLFQKGTQKSDGVPFVTQDPIRPHSSYLYITNAADQTGTFMYHAHTGLDLAFAYGGLIIKDGWELARNPIYSYDEEILLICNQYWHVPIETIRRGVANAPLKDVPDTASILINGRSYGVWGNMKSSDRHIIDNTVPGYTVINVQRGRKYRFRVIGLGVDSMIRMRIEGHTNLKVIEVDGILTDPVITDHLDLNAAQRTSIIVEMDQPIGNYWIVSEMYPGPGPRNGRAILHYEGAPDPTPLMTMEFPGQTEEIELDRWILDKLHPSTSVNVGSYAVPKKVDTEFVIKSFQRNFPDGGKKFDVNGVLIRPTDVGPTLINLNKDQLLANAAYYGLYEIRLNDAVQIVFQNTMSDDGGCEQHPWHLHGHNFHIVGSGPDAYGPDDRALINRIVSTRKDFIVRDVLTLFPDQVVENTTSQAPCGWIAVRFVADNPGLWLTHCHLTAHQIMGKHFVLYEH